MSRKKEDDDLLQLRPKNHVHNFETEIATKHCLILGEVWSNEIYIKICST
jgi:hypothetical protein